MKIRFFRSIGALTACFLLVSVAQAAGYNFRLIADTSGPFTSVGLPQINNSGIVAFATSVDSGVRGIYTGNGGPLTLIADTSESSPFFRFLSGPRINNAGTVVFSALNDSIDRGIYTGNGGPVTTVIDETTSEIQGYSTVGISDDGTVAFKGDTPIATGAYTIKDGVVTTVADTTGPISAIGGGPATVVINANGVVAFEAELDNGGQAIFSGTGGPLTTIADTLGDFIDFRPIGINSFGRVAFSADVDGGGRGVYSGDGGPITTIVDPGSETFDFIGGFMSINTDGTVVFRARLAGGEGGLFLGDDPLTDTVILEGEMLDGKLIDIVETKHWQAINDRGDVAFKANFADGSEGIYVATLIPIPAAAWMFGSALGLLGWLKRRTA